MTQPYFSPFFGRSCLHPIFVYIVFCIYPYTHFYPGGGSVAYTPIWRIYAHPPMSHFWSLFREIPPGSHQWDHFWEDFAYSYFGILYAYLTTDGYVVDDWVIGADIGDILTNLVIFSNFPQMGPFLGNLGFPGKGPFLGNLGTYSQVSEV